MLDATESIARAVILIPVNKSFCEMHGRMYVSVQFTFGLTNEKALLALKQRISPGFSGASQVLRFLK